jgi:hypothetical protein
MSGTGNAQASGFFAVPVKSPDEAAHASLPAVDWCCRGGANEVSARLYYAI